MALINHTLYLILTLSSFIEFLNPAAHINLPVRIFSAEMSLRCLWGVGEGRSTENLVSIFSSLGWRSLTAGLFFQLDGSSWGSDFSSVYTSVCHSAKGKKMPWKEALCELENSQRMWGTRVWRGGEGGLEDTNHQSLLPPPDVAYSGHPPVTG